MGRGHSVPQGSRADSASTCSRGQQTGIVDAAVQLQCRLCGALGAVGPHPLGQGLAKGVDVVLADGEARCQLMAAVALEQRGQLPQRVDDGETAVAAAAGLAPPPRPDR